MQVLEKIVFEHATHEPSMSRAIINNKEVLLARQVDDFRFAAENKETVDQVLQSLKMKVRILIAQINQNLMD